MKDILKYMKKFIMSFINNENYINLISIIVVAITTYYVTKYATLKPNRLSIKQSQLDNVYLPLHLLFENMPQSISKSDALVYSKKISNILDKHYILAFPQLHKLNQKLKEEIIHNLEYEETLYTIKHQVNIDFELLKKTLGYPSEKFFHTFKRMTLKQKIDYIYPLFTVCFVIIILLLEFIPQDFFGKHTILITCSIDFIGALIMLLFTIIYNEQI